MGWNNLFIPKHNNGCNYLSILELKLNHVSRRGHWCQITSVSKLIPYLFYDSAQSCTYADSADLFSHDFDCSLNQGDELPCQYIHTKTDSKVHGSYMRPTSCRPTWGLQDPGGPHVGPMNLAIREHSSVIQYCLAKINIVNVQLISYITSHDKRMLLKSHSLLCRCCLIWSCLYMSFTWTICAFSCFSWLILRYPELCWLRNEQTSCDSCPMI